MPIIPFINLKGGVGKTVSAVAIAEAMATLDKTLRVLVIDADHQCSAGELLLGQDRHAAVEKKGLTLYALLKRLLDDDFDAGSLDSFVTRKGSNIAGGLPNLSVLPCSIMIEDIETNIARGRKKFLTPDDFNKMWGKRAHQVHGWLSRCYDFVIIDCPPSLNKHVRFLMRASDAYVIPCVPDRLSIRGAKYLIQRLANVGIKTPGLGTLWSLYRQASDVHRDFVAAAARGHEQLRFLPKPLETPVPVAAAVSRACEEQSPNGFQSLADKYESSFAAKFRALASEIMARTEKMGVKVTKPAPQGGRESGRERVARSGA
jgi:chromosome partitioning protein